MACIPALKMIGIAINGIATHAEVMYGVLSEFVVIVHSVKFNVFF
jgi:hypothetical protein